MSITTTCLLAAGALKSWGMVGWLGWAGGASTRVKWASENLAWQTIPNFLQSQWIEHDSSGFLIAKAHVSESNQNILMYSLLRSAFLPKQQGDAII